MKIDSPETVAPINKPIPKPSSVENSVEETKATNQTTVFIPALYGLSSPYNRTDIKGAFFNIRPQTRQNNYGRAILDSVAFRTHQLLEMLKSETKLSINLISVNGGISKNYYIIQTIANLQRTSQGV